jgi:threonine dehydratase
LLTSLGDKTFPVIKELVSKVITVNDQEIKDAMRLLWEKLRTIVEPSGAVPMAAVLKSAEKFRGQRIGIILSGGNVDLEKKFF